MPPLKDRTALSSSGCVATLLYLIEMLDTRDVVAISRASPPTDSFHHDYTKVILKKHSERYINITVRSKLKYIPSMMLLYYPVFV